MLTERGLSAEGRVAVLLERGPELAAALLGVWQAGGAYVPLDPTYLAGAAERVGAITADAGVMLAITSREYAGLFPAELPLLFPADLERAEVGGGGPSWAGTESGAAYVLYTSGSTGRPKGVVVTHGNLEHVYRGWEREYGLRPGESHLQGAGSGFDVYTGDLVRSLCSGGRLVTAAKETLLDPGALAALVRREAIGAAEFVPAVLRPLVAHLEERREGLPSLRLIAVGSDAWFTADHDRARRVLGCEAAGDRDWSTLTA